MIADLGFGGVVTEKKSRQRNPPGNKNLKTTEFCTP
jgi:hypothetical protein